MAKFIAIKLLNTLRPADEAGEEALRQMANGELVTLLAGKLIKAPLRVGDKVHDKTANRNIHGEIVAIRDERVFVDWSNELMQARRHLADLERVHD